MKVKNSTLAEEGKESLCQAGALPGGSPFRINFFCRLGVQIFGFSTDISSVSLILESDVTTSVGRHQLSEEVWVRCVCVCFEMVYKYKRKSEQQSWVAGAMQRAIEAVTNDGMAYSTAAKTFSVPRNTLKRRVLEEQEAELVRHIMDLEVRFFGVTILDLRSLAYSLAEKNGIPNNFNRETKMAGFRHRHPEISSRKPEQTSAAMAQAFNKHNESNETVHENEEFNGTEEVESNKEVNEIEGVNTERNPDKQDDVTTNTKSNKKAKKEFQSPKKPMPNKR
ncbi:hypothetical protein JTB14_014145 [Gonioctena quinquepunctata]|nr:hypothetical protein JTB14_014145 [Gonioctena quinquepunctata]